MYIDLTMTRMPSSILPLEIDISKLSYKCRFTYITYSYYKMFTTKK